jgi:hypothetical protein
MLLAIATVWIGLCLIVAIAIEHRISRAEHMARRIAYLMQR